MAIWVAFSNFPSTQNPFGWWWLWERHFACPLICLAVRAQGSKRDITRCWPGCGRGYLLAFGISWLPKDFLFSYCKQNQKFTLTRMRWGGNSQFFWENMEHVLGKPNLPCLQLGPSQTLWGHVVLFAQIKHTDPTTYGPTNLAQKWGYWKKVPSGSKCLGETCPPSGPFSQSNRKKPLQTRSLGRPLCFKEENVGETKGRMLKEWEKEQMDGEKGRHLFGCYFKGDNYLWGCSAHTPLSRSL